MTSGTPQVDDVDLLRSRVYALLASLVARPPSAGLLNTLADLSGDASPLGKAIDDLAAAAGTTTAEAARREFEALFVGVVRGEVVPYASYYVTGFLNDRPLGRLRRDLEAIGVERAPGVPEPEDHLASECEVMAGLITGDLAETASQFRFFDAHLRPWAGRCFADIERAESARLYRPVGTLGRLLMDIETEAFAIEAKAQE